MRLFAWCDAPDAPTGFGRSVNHVLYALHGAGFEVVQLAVNATEKTVSSTPWRVYVPSHRGGDAYGLRDLARILHDEAPDMLWTTFDPEVPWRYPIGKNQQAMSAFHELRMKNPGFRSLGWFTIDGGPLSDFELSVLGAAPFFDVVATMSPHVHDLIAWTLKLKGQSPNLEKIRERVNVVPGAIDLERYTIPTDEERAEAKRRIGIDPSTRVVLQVERNQQRKNNWLAFRVMQLLFANDPKLRGNVVLYQHMAPDEETQGCQMGFNLPELAWRFGLQKNVDVRWPMKWSDEESMPGNVYAAADVFLSVSTGEGFQYPAWEAIACGIPTVLPNDTSRKAWLSKTPNVHLYRTDETAFVMRNAYNRLMGFADAGAAAKIVGKILRGKGFKFARRAEEGRAFVQKTASLESVTGWWVQKAKELEADLLAERREMSIVTPGHPDPELDFDELIAMVPGPGLGDLVMMAPAFRALQERGKRLRVHLPATHIDLARLIGLADSYELHRGVVPPEAIRLDMLYHPKHAAGWGDPQTHRSDVIAGFLGIHPRELRAFVVALPDALAAARSQFFESFGVDPTECVAIAGESANPHRALPKAYILEIAELVRKMGATPLILGSRPLGIRRIGMIDVTGQTNLATLLSLLDQVGAVISTDTSTLHFAGMFGTPLVGCFSLFEPDTRLRYYAGPKRAVIPDVEKLAGECFPAGPFPKAEPGEWAKHLSPKVIVDALAELLELEAPEPEIILPNSDTL